LDCIYCKHIELNGSTEPIINPESNNMLKVTTFYYYSNFEESPLHSITIEGIKADGKPLFKHWNNPFSDNDYIQSNWINSAIERCEVIAEEHGQGIAWLHSEA